jgi:O-antigen/teichoic acid export membrane protein
VSRVRRAAVAASFSYLQYALAIASGIVLVPLTLHYVGARAYGLWLASGELLAYAAMVDLGVVGVLPWMLAEADGRGDRDRMRGLVVNGLAVGVAGSIGLGVLAGVLWLVLPSALALGSADRQALGGPLAILVLTTMVVFPLRVFSAVVTGLQDVAFAGAVAVAQNLLVIVVTVLLLANGYGILALAGAAALSSLLSVVAAVVRTSRIAPDLLAGWPRPSTDMIRVLLSNGVGVWLGAFGWQLAASHGLVIAALGRPEWVAVWACTSKLTSMATQLTWVVPDAGLVGLAQVHGERPDVGRVRPLVLTLLRLHLLLAGGAACGLLVFNPAFVARWVGADLFGGLALNALLAVGIVSSSLAHGVLTASAVVGHRLRVGAVTLAAGLLQVACALGLGLAWGLPGVALASLLVALGLVVPIGVRLLGPATALTAAAAWRELVRPWGVRAAPLLFLSGACGLLSRRLGVPGTLALGATLGLAYVWHLRPMYVGLPFDERVGRWLVSLRLVPAPAGDAARGA